MSGRKKSWLFALLVLPAVSGSLFVGTVEEVVDKVDAAVPVAIADVAETLEVILFAREVPHKITPVHPPKLVVGKIAYFIGHGRIFAFGKTTKFTIHEFLVAFIAIVLHARKKMRRFHAGIILFLDLTGLFVFVLALYIKFTFIHKIFVGGFFGEEGSI